MKEAGVEPRSSAPWRWPSKHSSRSNDFNSTEENANEGGVTTIKRRPRTPLTKKARKGFRGYPLATIACCGPDAERASKVPVGIILLRGRRAGRAGTVVVRKRAMFESDPTINEAILAFIRARGVPHRGHGGSDHRLSARGRRRLSRGQSLPPLSVLGDARSMVR